MSIVSSTQEAFAIEWKNPVAVLGWVVYGYSDEGAYFRIRCH